LGGDIFRDSFSEVMEGIVIRSFSKGETTEVGKSGIVIEQPGNEKGKVKR